MKKISLVYMKKLIWLYIKINLSFMQSIHTVNEFQFLVWYFLNHISLFGEKNYFALYICTQRMSVLHSFPEVWEEKDLESTTLPIVNLIMIACLVRGKVNSMKQ